MWVVQLFAIENDAAMNTGVQETESLVHMD